MMVVLLVKTDTECPRNDAAKYIF